MRRFKLRELIVSVPDMEGDARVEMQAGVVRGPDICRQVTLLECGNGVTQMDPIGGGWVGCRQVTLLECGNGITATLCDGRTLEPACRQVTFLECGNGVTAIHCGGRTIDPGCDQVTLLGCDATFAGAPKRPCYGCTYDLPVTKPRPEPAPVPCGGDTRRETQTCSNNCPPKPNCGSCTDYTPQCTSATEDCGSCTHATEDAQLFVRTFEVDRMPIESLDVLRKQLHEIMARVEIAEKRFSPQSAEELDALEAKLKDGLAEIKVMRQSIDNQDKGGSKA